MKWDLSTAGRQNLGRRRPEESVGRGAQISRTKPAQSLEPPCGEFALRKEGRGLQAEAGQWQQRWMLGLM
jgi:hypothetical protein